MAVARGEIWFAPGVRMVDLDFNDFRFLVDAFRRRVEGFFLDPIDALRGMQPAESGLFVSVLACAATIEFLSTIESPSRDQDRIKSWLEAHVPQFREAFGSKTLAQFFEERYRHHLAHKAYISLGRLGDFDGIVQVDGGAVTVNPFALSRALRSWLVRFSDDLCEGRRDARAFCHVLRPLFEPEVELARAEQATV